MAKRGLLFLTPPSILNMQWPLTPKASGAGRLRPWSKLIPQATWNFKNLLYRSLIYSH